MHNFFFLNEKIMCMQFRGCRTARLILPEPVLMGASPTLTPPPSMEPRGRRHYVFYCNRVRHEILEWLKTLGGNIPMTIYATLMHSEWETWVLPPVGLRIGVFMVILYFFEANDAPKALRRMFWNWILPKPLIPVDGMVSPDHPYIRTFFDAEALDVNALRECYAFYNVSGRDLVHDWSIFSVWKAFNVWDCDIGSIADEGDTDEESDDENST